MFVRRIVCMWGSPRLPRVLLSAVIDGFVRCGGAAGAGSAAQPRDRGRWHS